MIVTQQSHILFSLPVSLLGVGVPLGLGALSSLMFPANFSEYSGNTFDGP